MRVILGNLNDELLANIANQAAPFCSEVDAAVAYAVGNDHPLIRSCKDNKLFLRFYGLLDDDGAVSPSLLSELLAWGPSRANAFLVNGHFHAKVIWWRGYGAYVGSANLTHKAWFNNIEAGTFFGEEDLISSGAGVHLDQMFDHLAGHSIPVTSEVVEKLERLARDRGHLRKEHDRTVGAKFKQLFGYLPQNPGLTVEPPKGHRVDTGLSRFANEWMKTLQLMRGLARDFAEFRLRPSWVDEDAHPAIHFDQFLHAYYYDYVRAATVDDDEELAGLSKVESFFAKHRANPAEALKEAAHWWAALPSDPYKEAEFIRETAPAMRVKLSKDALLGMDLPSFREALRDVNAFRMHARQVKNVEYGLPAEHHETLDQRVNRLCDWLWKQKTPAGKGVRDTLEFVIWGTEPSDMEQRLWLAVSNEKYHLPHFGQSTLGEAVGWARPEKYPPRNNRTNKALRALGHDVKLFSNA